MSFKVVAGVIKDAGNVAESKNCYIKLDPIKSIGDTYKGAEYIDSTDDAGNYSINVPLGNYDIFLSYDYGRNYERIGRIQIVDSTPSPVTISTLLGDQIIPTIPQVTAAQQAADQAAASATQSAASATQSAASATAAAASAAAAASGGGGGGGGGSSDSGGTLPINSMLAINSLDAKYTAPNGSEWLRTGTTALDTNGDYPDAQKVTDYKYVQNSTVNSQSFDVTQQTPSAMCWDGTSFWVVAAPSGQAGVFQYDSSGVYTGTSFSTTSEDNSIGGITFDGTNFWICGDDSNAVYKYDHSGTYTGENFTISSQISIPRDITWDGTYFWIIGGNTNSIYRYDSSGSYSLFSFIPRPDNQSIGPVAMAWDGASIWIAGFVTDSVYQYDTDGNYTGNSFSIVDEEQSPSGLAYDGSSFWVIGGQSTAIQYLPGQFVGVETAATDNGVPVYTRIK